MKMDAAAPVSLLATAALVVGLAGPAQAGDSLGKGVRAYGKTDNCLLVGLGKRKFLERGGTSVPTNAKGFKRAKKAALPPGAGGKWWQSERGESLYKFRSRKVGQAPGSGVALRSFFLGFRR